MTNQALRTITLFTRAVLLTAFITNSHAVKVTAPLWQLAAPQLHGAPGFLLLEEIDEAQFGVRPDIGFLSL